MADLIDKCSDPLYRLCVYEAGHALVAWALNQKIIKVVMLPRPPVTMTEKLIVGNSWKAFERVLELRVMELFGGQIAEEITCGQTTCCAGDISRIDEITRILSGLSEQEDHEDTFFRLEDEAQRILDMPGYREAIVPVADLLFERESAGELEIDGAAVEAVIAEYVPREDTKKTGPLGFLKRFTG